MIIEGSGKVYVDYGLPTERLIGGIDIAFSKDKNIIIARKNVSLFGGEHVDMYGQGDTIEEAKKDLDENIVQFQTEVSEVISKLKPNIN
jgi:hypothetical protein